MKRGDESEEIQLGVMDCFALALIAKIGLRSLYSLQREASLQPGSIRPVLLRLEQLGLVAWTAPAKRRRRDLSVTESGIELLKRTWEMCLREHADADTAVRAGWIALLMADPQCAAAYLESMAALRRKQAEDLTAESEYLNRSQSGPVSTYAWMRTLTEAHRRGAESEAFFAISRSMKERLKNHEDTQARPQSRRVKPDR